jgi:hypothetical protein
LVKTLKPAKIVSWSIGKRRLGVKDEAKALIHHQGIISPPRRDFARLNLHLIPL